MANIKLNQVLEKAKTLPPDEKRQLRDKLDEWLQQKRPEDRLEQLLYEQGLLSDIKPYTSTTTPHGHFKPIEVRGKPVSETIIKERN